MTNYYYDEEQQKLLAIDTETNDVRVLEPIDFEDDDEAPKRGPAVKFSKQPRKLGEGCPECGSKSRHRKECSKATGAKPATTAKSSKLSKQTTKFARNNSVTMRPVRMSRSVLTIR